MNTRQFWEKITHIGVDETTDPLEVRFIVLMNTLVIIVSLFEFSYILLFVPYLPHTKILIYLFSAAVTLNLGAVLLNHFRNYLLARQCFHFVTVILLVAATILAGKEPLVHFFLLESIVVAFFIYPVREKLFMYAKIFVDATAFVCLEMLVPDHTGLLQVPPEFFLTIKYGVVGGLLILMIAISFYSYTIVNRSEAGLEEERRKSENLLLNILPQPIAKRLKADSGYISDRYQEATILFADIVNFSEMAKNISPDRMVSMLDEIFTEFDRIADKYGLEKIKTIGDAYMVAGGIPEVRPDHCEAVADMALSMQEAVKGNLSGKYHGLKLRIGMHSGPVVAGVIGRRKFIYDLWGDSVNTASRMESYGIEDKIQVTQDVYDKLKDRYLFQYRGNINIKGKDEMKTYMLAGRK